jgi:hypothetical protein
LQPRSDFASESQIARINRVKSSQLVFCSKTPPSCERVTSVHLPCATQPTEGCRASFAARRPVTGGKAACFTRKQHDSSTEELSLLYRHASTFATCITSGLTPIGAACLHLNCEPCSRTRDHLLGLPPPLYASLSGDDRHTTCTTLQARLYCTE